MHRLITIVVDPATTSSVPTLPVQTFTIQILAWINSLTLPALILGAVKASRWLTRKEDELRSGVDGFKQELATIRGNHLHHIQESLDNLNKGQADSLQATAEQSAAGIAATNASKDAIVQAIISIKR